jgi:hypothetical protein
MATDDAEIDRQAKAIHDAVSACRRALADLLIEEKLPALRHLEGWLELERLSLLPEADRKRRH